MSLDADERHTKSIELTRALAERSCTLSYEDIPGDVIELARQCVLDWFGVTLAGSSQEGPRMLLEVLAPRAQGARGEGVPDEGPHRGDGDHDHGTATIVGHTARATPLHAALVNGTASHVLDFDDVNIELMGHMSVAVLGAALALAEQRAADASELLTAFVAGYETACRVAVALGPEPYLRGYHATGTVGAFGATAACARLLGLDATRTATATGIAASEAAGLKINFGTMTKSLHVGRACESGLLAALLAERGFTASSSALEGAQGFAAASGAACDADAALAAPRSGWHLRKNLFKHHATCFFTHSTIEGLRALRASRSFAPDEIERISIHVSELELGTCVIPRPSTALEVKFSLAHLAAMTLLGRATSRIGDADARDEEVIALRAKVALLKDGSPGQPTRVEVALRNSEVLSAAREVNAPARDLDAQRSRLEEKFASLAEPVLGSAAAATLLQALSSLDPRQDTPRLMALARR